MSNRLIGVFIWSIFAMCYVESTELGWIKNKLSNLKHNWGKMTQDQITRFKQSFGGSTNVDRFMLALDRMNAATNRIVTTDAEKSDWAARMKNLKSHVLSPRLPNEKKDITEVNEAAGVAGSLFGGDMKLTDSQIDALLGEFLDDVPIDITTKTKRQAFYDGTYPRNIWGTTFYYYFDSDIPVETEEMVRISIEFWQNMTCINFVEDASAPNRVRIYRGDDCSSYVGMIGGEQDLSLTDDCVNFRNTAHELGHALGFYHEMTRHDSNSSIKVYLDNVKDGKKSNFYVAGTDTNYNFGMPYEYGSLMQYRDTAFSLDGNKKTIISYVVPYQDVMGSNQVAFYDISMMNELYQCKKFCPTGAACVNGGFRNSKNCNTCICPSGWGGATCSDRPTGCGATLTATATLQTQSATVGVADSGEEILFELCNYLIMAPAGNKVQLTINSLATDQCRAGCTLKSLEVKAINDHRYTGIRYCCLDDIDTIVVSEGHIMPVILNNRHGESFYSFSYKYVPASTESTVTMSQFPGASATYDTPTNPATTTTKAPTTTSLYCVDSSVCPGLIRDYNFCDSPSYSKVGKRKYCPISCNMCYDNQIWSAITKTSKATATTKKVTTTTPVPACGRCAQNVSDYNQESLTASLGTPTFSYSVDSASNCLIADWHCQVAVPPYKSAAFQLYTGAGYRDQFYNYFENGKAVLGLNDATSQGDYQPFVCDDTSQWSFNGVTDFVFDCYAYQ